MPSVSIGFCVAITTKGLGHGMAFAGDGDLALLHHFQQRALHLGRGAVDFVGQHQIGEDRPQHGGEFAALLVVDARAESDRRAPGRA